MLTAGIDIGSAAVKVAIMRQDGADPELVATEFVRYRRRDPKLVVEQTFDAASGRAGVAYDDFAYVATTGEGDLAPRRHGHFYGMTTHARGAIFLAPEAKSVLDAGALHARAIKIDPRGRVLSYRMTSQCASGSGQFIENIARYLGVALEDVGDLSLNSESTEKVSSICAVLAETDVINMVARGITAPAILRGIHTAVGGRLASLLRICKVESPVCITGGLSKDVGLRAAVTRQSGKRGLNLDIIAPEKAIYAGAIGAAIWGAYRAKRLKESASHA